MIRPVDQHCKERERKASLFGPPAILKTPAHTHAHVHAQASKHIYTHTHTAHPLWTHHTEQGPFVEGRMESDKLSLGSWLPLDNAT